MANYSFHICKKVRNTKIGLYKLSIDNECQFDTFTKEIIEEGKYIEDLNGIYAILEKVCNLTMLPKGMYRVLNLGKQSFQVYEAKRGNLRVYLVKIEDKGKVIVYGGRKVDQKEDLENLKKLTKNIKNEVLPVAKPKKK